MKFKIVRRMYVTTEYVKEFEADSPQEARDKAEEDLSNGYDGSWRNREVMCYDETIRTEPVEEIPDASQSH